MLQLILPFAALILPYAGLAILLEYRHPPKFLWYITDSRNVCWAAKATSGLAAVGMMLGLDPIEGQQIKWPNGKTYIISQIEELEGRRVDLKLQRKNELLEVRVERTK